MLGALLAELERAARHAPSPAELEGARAALATAARQAAVSEGNRHSRWVLADLEEAVGLAYVPIGKTRAAALVEELLPAVAAEEVRDAVAAGFTAPARLLLGVVPGDPEADVPDDPGLVAVLREVEAAPLPAAPPRVAPERLMRRRPRRPRGGFLDEDEAFGVRSATLPNGVRVHVREMDARRERVFVTVTVAGGRIRERAEDLGVTAAAALAWTQPATLELPSVAIRDHLGARAIALAASVDEDALSLRLAADPAHLEEGLQLVHLLLTRPRVEAAALRRWQDRIRAYAPAQARSLEVLVAERTLALLTGHDPRFGLLTAEQAEAISVKGAQRWLDEAVRTAPVEAALVGHAPADRLLDLAARYLGSLPRRPVRDDALAPLRALAPSAGPLDAALSVRTDSETSAVVVGWRTAPWQEVRTRRVLQMAEQVLLARVRAELREERGLSYSPEASFAPSRAYPAASLLSVSALAAPANAGETERVIVGLVDRLAREGPTEGEMGTLRMQFAGLVRRAREDPRFWSRELADLDYHGGRVADLVGMPVAFAACTAAEMRDVLAGVAGEAGRLAVIGSPARPQP